jgi:DNA-binding Lrp family transcriptional regulator
VLSPGQDDLDPEAAMRLDEQSRQILAIIQAEFPLCRSPYREIARRVGLSEQAVYERVAALRQSGLIRRIGGVVSSQKLGYVGTLVAMRVPPERVDEFAAVINALPNVTHNYLRDHHYNVWFTLTALSAYELAETVAHIRDTTGITDVLDLPSLSTFKIDVRLDFSRPCRSS